MPYVLGPITVPDQYTPQSTLEQRVACVRVTLWVSLNAVYYQTRNAGDVNWGAEIFVPASSVNSTFLSVDRHATSIRVRNAVPGSAASFFAELVTTAELPDSAA